MEFTELFLHLFNVSVSASFLVAAVLVLRFIFKKVPKWLTVFLWALVGIRLILPFSVESALSLIPSAEMIPTEIMSVDPTKTHDTTFGLIDNPTYSDIFNSTVVVDDVDSFQLDVMFASYGWLIGVAMLLLYALVSYLRLRHTVRVSMPYKDNVWLCDSVKSPFILGVFRPKIYLPSDMDEETAQLVLRHEKEHIKRKDHIWKPLGFVLLSVYWFNPVMWLAYVLLCRDIELACDEKVISEMATEDKKAYSEALFSCSQPKSAISACPVAFGEVGVKKRIKSVLDYKKPAFWLVAVAVVVSVVVALCFMTDPKEKNGGQNYIDGVDKISELSFPMKEILRSAQSYTIYEGVSTTDNYFKFDSDNRYTYNQIYHFFDYLTLGELADGTVNPKQEPKSDGIIKIQTADHAPVTVIFHDDFQKMYMQKRSEFYSVRSKDYAVLSVEKARSFFDDKLYLDDFMWEFNPASSASGNIEVRIFVDKKFQINGDATGEGTITRISDEEKGEGIAWRPDVIENPDEYHIEIPVVYEGKASVFELEMVKIGKRGLASFYSLECEDTVVSAYDDGYSVLLSLPEDKDDLKWYCNPMYSAVAYGVMSFILPEDYTFESIEAESGTTEIKDRFYNNPDGEKMARWQPDYTNMDEIPQVEIVVKAKKQKEEKSFSFKVNRIEKDYSGGTMFQLVPEDCKITKHGWGFYLIEEN